MKRQQKFLKYHLLVLMLLSKFQNKWEIVFKFYGLLTMSELYVQVLNYCITESIKNSYDQIQNTNQKDKFLFSLIYYFLGRPL